MALPKSHVFRGWKYRIYWRKPRKSKAEQKLSKAKDLDVFGRCWPPGPDAKMYISLDEQDSFEFLSTILDESFHACLFDIDNDAVGETVDDIIKLLKRMKMKITFEK